MRGRLPAPSMASTPHSSIERSLAHPELEDRIEAELAEFGRIK